jgi:TPR repeat protein
MEETIIALKEEECPLCRTALPLTESDRLALVQQNADRNLPWANYKLGMYKKDGIGTNKDPVGALQHFLVSAKAGFTRAQHEAGLCYRFGNGTRADIEEAARWFEKAADSGFALSQYQLSRIIDGNAGPSAVPVDLKLAFKLLEQASLQGLNEAQCDLAYAYEHGLGVDESLERSIHWNRQAAMQGNATAQANLGGNYLNAASVANRGPADRAMPVALFWANKAVEGGNAEAKMLTLQLEAALSKCAYCRSSGPMQRCSRCLSCRYCSRDHQKAHWKFHKRSCTEAKEAAEEYERHRSLKVEAGMGT